VSVCAPTRWKAVDGGHVYDLVHAAFATQPAAAQASTHAGIGAEAEVTFGHHLRQVFPDLHPVVDDLFLLDAHQVAGLPERAPTRELAAVLHAHPRLYRFLVARHPPIEGFLSQISNEQDAVGNDDLVLCEDALVWELADWILYQRAPEYYHAEATIGWDLAAATDVVSLDGKVVIDAGAGTGVVAVAACPTAREVFAVEPVATLREYMRDRANELGIDNLFVLDGFLHAIPLPAACADVLVTRQAIGWQLEEELLEIERVLKQGGIALHLFERPEVTDSVDLVLQTLVAHGYQPGSCQEGHNRSYWKQVGV